MAKILIAEDSEPLSKAMSLKLTKLNHEVHVFADGSEALKSLEETKYDFLVLDIMMPGMNGFDVLENLHSKGIKIPTVITSNLSQEIDVVKAKEQYGVLEYFVKSSAPINNIVDYINNALAHEHSSDPGLATAA